jgi:hypothetical protein
METLINLPDILSCSPNNRHFFITGNAPKIPMKATRNEKKHKRRCFYGDEAQT